MFGISIEIFEKTNKGESEFTNDQDIPDIKTPIEFYSKIGQEVILNIFFYFLNFFFSINFNLNYF